MDALHVVGEALPQQQEVATLVLGESVEELRGGGVVRRGRGRARWSRGRSSSTLEGGDMVRRCRGTQERQRGVEERHVGKQDDIIQITFCGSVQGNVLKSGRNEEDCRLREFYATEAQSGSAP